MNHESAVVCTALIVMLFVGCDSTRRGSQQTPAPDKGQEPMVSAVTVLPDDGFGADLMIPVQDHKQLADGSQIIRAGGLFRGRQIAVELSIGAGTGTIAYRRIGQESDALLSVLDDLYGTKLDPSRMAEETIFAIVALQGDPNKLAKGPVKMKLFYEKGGEDRYAELYTNIDLARRTLELSEKDEGYRRQVIQALQQK